MATSFLKDIDELVHANIISSDTAQSIITYYQQKKETAPDKLNIILGILGAMLVGSGIILIVAHNWDELSRSFKTTLSFIPLLLAQLLCAYTLIKQKHNAAWKESSAVLLFFAVGTSISLISQIYQVSGSLSGFLLTWVLLTLPLIYLLSSVLVSLLCIAAITWYACITGYFDSTDSIPFMYAVTIAAIIPFYYKLYQVKKNSNYIHLLNWFLSLSLIIVLGAFTKDTDDWYDWVFALYLLVLCIYYFTGSSAAFAEKKLFANPFLFIGVGGILFILFMWSFDFLWKEYEPARNVYELLFNPLSWLVVVALIMAILSGRKNFQHQTIKLFDPTGFSFAVFLVTLLLQGQYTPAAVFIINIWVLGIALFFILKGAKANHLGILNFGLIIIAILAICRFFDDQIPFIWRGIFFVAAGAGFFIANYLMLRKRKQLNTKP